MAQSQKVAHRTRGRALRTKRSRRLPLLMIVLALGVLLGGAIVVSKLAQPAENVTPPLALRRKATRIKAAPMPPLP
jgi:hypothetical protein